MAYLDPDDLNWNQGTQYSALQFYLKQLDESVIKFQPFKLSEDNLNVMAV